MTGLLLAIALFSPAAPGQAPKAAVAQTSSHHGAAFTLKKQITFDEVAKNPKAFGDKTVLVSAKIKSVCKKKGCWLVLEGSDPAAHARVTMKDYGFFAPLDCDGRNVIVEGKVAVKTLPEAERKHLAEDGKTTVDTIPKHELRIEATGLKVI